MRRATFGLGLGSALLSIRAPVLAQADFVNRARRVDLEGKQDPGMALYEQAL